MRIVYLTQKGNVRAEQCSPRRTAEDLPSGVACAFDWDDIVTSDDHPCSDKNLNGFAKEEPCVLVKINKVSHSLVRRKKIITCLIGLWLETRSRSESIKYAETSRQTHQQNEPESRRLRHLCRLGMSRMSLQENCSSFLAHVECRGYRCSERYGLLLIALSIGFIRTRGCTELLLSLSVSFDSRASEDVGSDRF